MTEQRLAYPIDLIERIGQYLSTKPFQEVFKLIHDLQTQGVKVETNLEEQ